MIFSGYFLTKFSSEYPITSIEVVTIGKRAASKDIPALVDPRIAEAVPSFTITRTIEVTVSIAQATIGTITAELAIVDITQVAATEQAIHKKAVRTIVITKARIVAIEAYPTCLLEVDHRQQLLHLDAAQIFQAINKLVTEEELVALDHQDPSTEEATQDELVEGDAPKVELTGASFRAD